MTKAPFESGNFDSRREFLRSATVGVASGNRPVQAEGKNAPVWHSSGVQGC